MTVVEIDLRVGGRWRYVLVGGNGQEVAFHGEYRNAHSDYMKDGLQEAMDLLEQTAISLATHLSRPGGRPLVPRDASSEEGCSWER
jgi:hypothetical protein